MNAPAAAFAEAVALDAKVALLASASTYGAAVAAVERIETHMSLLFVAGPRVYKLKKPVVYPFLDFRTLAARERNCRDEILLNRRLAPDVYQGLSTINRAADGRLSLDGEGEVVEWLVRMRALRRAAMLDRAIADATVRREAIDALAALLARFYLGAARGSLSADQYVGLLRREHAISRDVLAGFDAECGEPLLAEVQHFLDRDAGLLRARVRDRRLVDGHGDLRPEHVGLNTPPVVIDCLEFNHALRQVDPFDELAYFDMECRRLGAAWIGPILLAQVRAALDDPIDPKLLRFYTQYRACVRARLALAHLADPSPRDAPRWAPLARTYLRLGH